MERRPTRPSSGRVRPLHGKSPSTTIYISANLIQLQVYNSENFTVYDWEINIAEAQRAHIDAFALNIAYNFPTNNLSLANAFTAANALNFQLLFSFDYVGNGAWPEGEVIGLLRKYGNNTAYYQHNGKPFVSTFEGSSNATDWAFGPCSPGK